MPTSCTPSFLSLFRLAVEANRTTEKAETPVNVINSLAESSESKSRRVPAKALRTESRSRAVSLGGRKRSSIPVAVAAGESFHQLD